MSQVVRKTLRRGFPDHFVEGISVLVEIGLVDFREVLVVEDIIQHFFLIDRIVPFDRFIQHHKQETVDRMFEKEIQFFFLAKPFCFRMYLFRDIFHDTGDGEDLALLDIRGNVTA